MMKIALTAFAAGRHFDPTFGGTKIGSMTPDEFVAEVNRVAAESPEAPGYAPFCKHLFVRNTTDALDGVAEITEDNAHLLRSEYKARREGELAVLTRYFRSEDVTREKAEWLDLVLYDAQQCKAEGIDIGDAEWGIVAILSAPTPEEAPMNPITMMRNALGKDEGGSGHALVRDAYTASVVYWSKYATVR